MNTAPARRSFTARPHTVIVEKVDGTRHDMGTYANYFLAAPVLEAALALPSTRSGDFLITMPEAN